MDQDTPRPHIGAICAPSVFSLLARNLRLLNLDVREDWPGLPEDTFAVREDLRAKSKSRYRRAEWILYRLFELWDPEITTAGLAMYFPPLEPLQSIKLRSTAFLLLEDLKRNGVLPRGCPLRKSLLDDCIGPKFEDLLFSFSTVILQKRVTTSTSRRSPMIALASEQELHETSTEIIEPLSIAIQASIEDGLRRKNLSRQHHGVMQGELDVRDEYFRLLRECNGAVLAQGDDHLNEAEVNREDLKKQLRNSFSGDRSWSDVALSGEMNADRDLLAETDSFADLWDRAQLGQAPHVEGETSKSLMACLETMAASQNQRLRRWRNFQSQVSRRNGELVITRSPVTSPRKTPRRPPHSSPSKPSHRKFSDAQVTPLAKTRLTRRISSPKKSARAAGTLKDTDESEFKATQAASSSLERALFPAQTKTEEDRKNILKEAPHEQNGGPLSLAERTRKSMAFNGSQRPVTESEKTIEVNQHSSQKAPAQAEGEQGSLGNITESMASVSLAERTQQSMARMQRASSTKQKPTRTPIHQRSKSHQLTKKPAFPVNPFGESPLDKRLILEEPTSLSPSSPQHDHDASISEAVDGGEDSDSIFRPRHRLRMSPPGGSPVTARAPNGDG